MSGVSQECLQTMDSRQSGDEREVRGGSPGHRWQACWAQEFRLHGKFNSVGEWDDEILKNFLEVRKARAGRGTQWHGCTIKPGVRGRD